MNNHEDQKWIFATKHAELFYPEHITTLEDLDNLEYADVRNGEYQLWNWPSGDIYAIIPDREVELSDEYSTPYSKKGILWLPILEIIDNNKDIVNKAIEDLDK